MSVVRFRPRPPEFKANCSRLALLFLDFPRATRGSGRFCLCHGVRGVPEISPYSPRFDSVVLSVLKEKWRTVSIWHTQKAFGINGLCVCRKMWFDGETGAGMWGMSVWPCDLVGGSLRYMTIRSLGANVCRLGPVTRHSDLAAPKRSLKAHVGNQQCGDETDGWNTRIRPRSDGQVSGSGPSRVH